MIVSQFDLYESMSVAPFFNLTFVVNYGFAFGFLNSPSLNQIIVSIVILSIIIYFLYLLIKTQDNFLNMLSPDIVRSCRKFLRSILEDM